MKKIFFIASFVFLSFTSCQNDSLNPLPVKVDGQFMKLEIVKKQFLFSDINTTTFGGTLTDTSGKVVKYELFVRRTDSKGDVTGNYVKLKTITTFPYDLQISTSQLATALGISVSDFKVGDIFRFQAFSYDANGTKAGYYDLSRIIQTTKTLQQAYKFSTDITSSAATLDPSFDNRPEIF